MSSSTGSAMAQEMRQAIAIVGANTNFTQRKEVAEREEGHKMNNWLESLTWRGGAGYGFGE
jgi:hypothetical protein